jgi:hypothetical protein
MKRAYISNNCDTDLVEEMVTLLVRNEENGKVATKRLPECLTGTGLVDGYIRMLERQVE